MVCAGGSLGNAAVIADTLLTNAGLFPGYILVRTGHRVSPIGDDPIAADVVGVALATNTAATDTLVQAALAVPAQAFEANLTDGPSTDHTAAVDQDLNITTGLRRTNDPAYSSDIVGVDLDASSVNVYTYHYAKQHGPQQQFLGPLTVPTETYAASSTINPRVRFVFIDGVFF
jgi:hypothetical protein